jgi:TPR repeat protein
MKRSSLVPLVMAFAAVLFYPALAAAQDAKAAAPKTYKTLADEDLPAVAEKLRPPSATAAQMGVALVRTNQKVIYQRYDRDKKRLRTGTVLQVPDEATVMKLDAAKAETEFKRIWGAEQHFRTGLTLEKSKNMPKAFVSYVEAAKLGHGLAQYRLGQLYDRDITNSVDRDVQESVKWYQKARENQVNVPKPMSGDRPGFSSK